MSRRVTGLTPKSAILLAACLLLVGWAASKWVLRYQAVSQLRKDGFQYFDHTLGSDNDIAKTKRLSISQQTLAAIAFLQPRYVTVRGYPTITNLDFLSHLKSVENIDIEDCPALENVGALRNLPSTQWIVLTDCPGVHDLDVFSRMQSLHRLSLENCPDLRDFHGLQQLPSLTELSLADCQALTTLDELPAHPKLRNLSLYGCKHLHDIHGVTRFPALERLDLTDCVELRDISPLYTLTALDTVDLTGCTNLPPTQLRALRSALPNAQIFPEADDRPTTAPEDGNTTRLATSQPVATVERLVRTIDDNPSHLHIDDTPAVHELIEIGEPALRPVLPLMLADNELTRLHAWRVVEFVTMRKYGFRDGLGWPDEQGEPAWLRLYREMGSYDPEGPEPHRRHSVDLWSQWLSKRGL
jgi:hypothetical protein